MDCSCEVVPPALLFTCTYGNYDTFNAKWQLLQGIGVFQGTMADCSGAWIKAWPCLILFVMLLPSNLIELFTCAGGV